MNKKLTTLLIPWLGFVIGYSLLIGLFIGETELAKLSVNPPQNVDISEWLQKFRIAQTQWILYPAIGMGVVWVFVTIIHSGIKSDLRVFHNVLWSVCVALAFVATLTRSLPGTADTPLFAASFTVLNGIIGFWAFTGPFTIVTHKFAPLLSGGVRNLLRY